MPIISLSCPSCGANLHADDNEQILTCRYCGAFFEIEDAKDISLLLKERKCIQCGAPYNGGKFCFFCGANVIDLARKEIEYRNIPVVYGPPPEFAEVQCKACKTKWTVYKNRGEKGPQKTCCPNCGKIHTVRKFKRV